MRRYVLAAVLMLATAGTARAGRQAVIEGPRTLRGFGFESVAFAVPGDWMLNPRLRGRLEVTFGGAMDMDLLVLREADLAPWEKNREVKPLYAGKRVGRVDLDVPLPGPGSYVVVLSNRFSKLTRKEIAGEVLLTWDQDPSLPAGEALRRSVHFLDLSPVPDRLVVPVNPADSAAAVVLERGASGPWTIAARRRQGSEWRTSSVGECARKIEEVGDADVHADGDRDVLVVAAAHDSLGPRRDLVLVCPRQSASLTLSLVWPGGAQPARPGVRYGAGYAKARFAAEQSFLERIAGAYDRAAPDTLLARDGGARPAPRK